jgi:hypothetical protein
MEVTVPASVAAIVCLSATTCSRSAASTVRALAAKAGDRNVSIAVKSWLAQTSRSMAAKLRVAAVCSPDPLWYGWTWICSKVSSSVVIGGSAK